MKRSMFAALMKETTDSVVFSDLNGTYVEVSEKKAANWGLSRREMIGKNDFYFMSQEEALQAREDSLRVLENGEPIIDCVRKAIRNEYLFQVAI